MSASVFVETVYHHSDASGENCPHTRLHLGTIIDAVVDYRVTMAVWIPAGVWWLIWVWNQLDHVGLPVRFLLYGNMFVIACGLVTASLQVLSHLQRAGPHGDHRALAWESEVALVTGGCGGIGWLLTQRLAAKGARVVVWDVVKPPASKLAVDQNIRYYNVDISDSAAVEAGFQALEHDLGAQVTILVNNAGICRPRSLLDLSIDDIKRTFGVNTLAHFWTCKSALARMTATKYGHIVTVASTMGLTGVADMTDYCASKYACIGFHDALRQELNKLKFQHLIHSTLICPGLILTGMFSGIKIRVPFIVPPLSPVQVVDKIMSSLENVVGLGMPPVADLKLISEAVHGKRWSLADRMKQHKVLWFPSTYYLLPLLYQILPVYLNDLTKTLLGGNDAITQHFQGRHPTEAKGN